MAFDRRTLETPGQAAERKLQMSEGVDLLEPGGFAKRDAIRQAVSEQTQERKRLSRATNLAYRDAVRKGDRQGALQILMGASQNGIQFGGVRGAGRDREAAVNTIGEQASVARDAEAGEVTTTPDLAAGARAFDEYAAGGGMTPTESILRAEPDSGLLRDRQAFDERLRGDRKEGRLDKAAYDKRAKELKIPAKQAKEYWDKLVSTNVSPKERVSEEKEVEAMLADAAMGGEVARGESGVAGDAGERGERPEAVQDMGVARQLMDQFGFDTADGQASAPAPAGTLAGRTPEQNRAAAREFLASEGAGPLDRAAALAGPTANVLLQKGREMATTFAGRARQTAAMLGAKAEDIVSSDSEPSQFPVQDEMIAAAEKDLARRQERLKKLDDPINRKNVKLAEDYLKEIKRRKEKSKETRDDDYAATKYAQRRGELDVLRKEMAEMEATGQRGASYFLKQRKARKLADKIAKHEKLLSDIDAGLGS